ncbi:MAG: alpha/beta hydrolase [Pseudomonadota bacterium]
MTTLLLAISILYTAYAATLFFSQERLLFLPHVPGREMGATPRAIGLDYQTISLHTQDGIKLYGWFVPAAGARKTLLFFHGNAGNISHRLDSIRIFHDLGLDVLIFDYRGYGRSSGEPSEQGVYLDAQAAWKYLREIRGMKQDQIILFGRSLGGAIAAWLAARTRPGAVIIESAFTSVPDMAARFYPLVPVRLLARLQFNTLDAMSSIQSPVLISHSPEDEIIPFSHGKAIYEAAPSPKQFIELTGGHNEGHLLSSHSYSRDLGVFLDTHTHDE